MAAALECWSGRPSTDEDMVEQVLMKTHHRSELLPPPPIKKWHRLGRSLTSAIASLKSTLNLDTSPSTSTTSARFDKLWSGVVRSFTQLSPASPDCLISNMNRHFDSLPNSYAQAGFDMKEVLLHVRLIEQAAIEDRPVVHIKEQQDEGAIFKLAFACNGQISWPAMSGVLDTSLICCKKIQIFEKKGLTLGVITLLVQSGTERQFKLRIEAALRAAIKKPRNMGVKLPFGLCGCQEEGGNNLDDDDARLMGDNLEGDDPEANRQKPKSSLVVSVDEWQTMRSGGEEMGRWVLGSEEVEFGDRTGPSSFKGGHRGKRVWIKKLRGCERGNAYEVEVWQELLKLMSCGNRNILQFHGICIEEKQGLCVVTRMMEGGSVHDLIQKSRKVSVREVVKIAMDVAAGLKFMNDHGVAYRDLNVQRILLDRQGNACLGDMGVVTSLGNAGEVTEYETAGYRWLAPEIIAGDPESVTETWMSNVYSFGMVIWEMVTGEAAYSSYSPVQAAVGIAACGLRPDIPGDCPQLLRSLMLRCWNNSPSERPQFSEIITILQRYSYR